MRIGILCYASVGGSGIVATELAKALAQRGHDLHVISADVPFRLGGFQPGLAFHQVHTPSYPLFREPQYVLSLANKVVHVTRDHVLDVIHAHYAVPHATAALLAQDVIRSTSPARRAPCVITTLHGTDITLVGSDPSFSEIVAHSIERSDGVTAVSDSLRQSTHDQLGVRRPIETIPNCLDCGVYRRTPVPGLRERYAADPATRLVIHMSNFRPVKRVGTVIDVFARIQRRVPARLLLVGDGPDMELAHRRAEALGVLDRLDVLGEQESVIPLLSMADLFLLPSAQESFGLAALEAMACEVPVVASAVGGVPEVVEHGISGFLHPPDDVDAMAESGIALLSDEALHRRVTAAALARVQTSFCTERVVPMYEAYYQRIIDGKT